LAIITSLLSLLPFIIFCVMGARKVDPAKWLIVPTGGFRGVDWRLLLNTFFWNINFWESAASLAGEVQDPEKNYPLGMGLALVLVFVSLFFPVLIGTGASNAPYTEWTDGYFVQLAREIVGPWLAWWFMLAALLTNISMFEAEMSSDSWMVAGMADRGIIPKAMGRRHSKYGTPIYGIFISAMGVVFLGTLSFNQVIDMLNLLYCYGQLIEFCAFLYLRKYRPDMHRPFRIGTGLYGCCAMVLLPTVFVMIILAFSSRLSVLLSLVFGPLLGTALYQVISIAREKKWCGFRELVPTLPSSEAHTKGGKEGVKEGEKVEGSGGFLSSFLDS
jgi:amino acid transporter